MQMDYRDILDSQRNYAGTSKSMKELCKACNTDYIDYSVKGGSKSPKFECASCNK